jgi:hypothetical protein
MINHVADIDRNRASIRPGRDRTSFGGRIVFEPEYFEVFPGVSITTPVGLGYVFAGDSLINGAQNEQTGDVEVGVRVQYRQSWSGEISYTNYFGAPDRQFLTDRDFISISIRRTF